MYSDIYFGSVIGCLLIFLFAKHIYKNEFNFKEKIDEIQAQTFVDVRWVCILISLIPGLNTLFLILVIFNSKIK